MGRTSLSLWALVALAGAMTVVSWIGHVDQAPSSSDVQITRSYFGNRTKPEDFKEQVSLIAAVQAQVLKFAPHAVPIPVGRPREIQDLILAHSGWCYDRSRAAEQVLRVLGFEVRHANLYQTHGKNWFGVLLTPQIPSHAVIDVETSRGWLMVDSGANWLPIAANGEPLSARQLSEGWHPGLQEPAGPAKAFFGKKFVAVYGLYSRHGEFYPPYGPVPNFDILQVLRYDLFD